ncbi:DUF4886 domain-containing protein [Planctomycetes bacterium K23_9]|uniref:DUF4886 domain-containing protein n=1 Tax=Stieleria marina TaxID=1930275 RepID=A0A517NWP5_9BACT|nr:hypothetical protein K239x_35540 [Planctomycetes bacterium K23_9]
MSHRYRASLHSASTSVIAASCVLFLGSVAEAAPTERTVRVLTIGNSFANNALTFLPQIVEAAGHKVIVGRANLGGCTFERHWKHVAQHEANPDSKEGSPYEGGRHSLEAMLTSEQWDFITLQQVSYKSHDLKTYQPYADNLVRYVKKLAPEAKILVHQIWAYRMDDARFRPSNKGKEPHTHAVMYQQVREAYHQFADSHGLEVIPSGDAMFLADTDQRWGFRPDINFDFDNATYPNLPVQTHSLHTGWAWKKTKDGSHRLNLDGHHANRSGQYLLGCVWFETFFDESVVENPFVPKGIDPIYGKFLRQTAHAVTTAKLQGVQ